MPNKIYSFVHPRHGIFTGTKQDFIQVQGIDHSHLSKLLTGKINSLKGWYLPGSLNRKNLKAPDPNHYSFWHPEHGTFTGTKLEFRKKHLKESDTSNFFRFMAGTQRKVSGWQHGDAPPVVTTNKRATKRKSKVVTTDTQH